MNPSILQYLFLVIILVNALVQVSSRSMWGARRKKENEEVEVEVAATPFQNQQKRSLDVTPPVSGLTSVGVTNRLQTSAIEEMINMYVTMMEEMIDSDDFENLVNPSSIKSMMSQFPGFSESPELAALFDSPEFQDPELLRSTVKDGIQLIKASAPELIKMLSDPERLAELIDQLPDEAKAVFEGLKTGDFSAIKNIVNNLPGLDETQKKMLSNLMDGNTDAIAQQLNSVMSDADQIEAARLQFLESPEMAEALGISADVLNDPEQWAELMAEGMQALNQLGNEAA